MNRIPSPFLLALLLLLPSTAAAQAGPRPLAPGRVLTGSVAAERADTFALDLGADSFVRGVVTQESADVSVTVHAPAGATLTRADGRERGEERFFFESDSAGTYQVVVAPVEEAEGRYTIEILGVEPVATDPEARVDQLMASVTGEGVPGGVVAVVEGGEMVFAEAYGMADLTYGMPFRVNTPTNIGSTSKQFTAFALTLLDQRGDLSLDDDVREHIPELPDFGHEITLRNLLTHTTGYREFVNMLALGGHRFDEGDYVDPDELIRIVQRQPELQNEPGTEFNYNNTAYGLATVVVERVTGRPFAEWMEEEVFGPLGMHDTRVRTHPGEIVPRRARGYVPDKREGWREARDLGASKGAGGIYTTVEDLARWMANFGTGELGGHDPFERMTTRNVLVTGDTTDYGFGLFVDEYRGLRRIHHGGNDVAHSSMVRYFPAIDAGVITQTNNGTFNVSRVADEVADLFFADALEDETGDAVADASAGAPFDPADYDPEDFDVFAGRYELEEAPGVVIRFWRDEDRLLTQVAGQPEVEIAPASDSTFRLQAVDASVTFHRNDEGEVESATLHQNGDHPAKRLEGTAWEPSTAELEAYTGRYFSEELATFYEVTLEEDALVLRHRRFADDVDLKPAQRADVFDGSFPVLNVEFVRGGDGDVVALLAGNGRARDVRFERVGEAEGR